MSSLMPCPQEGCGAQISAESQECRSCGFPLQAFFQNGLEPFLAGVPIWPLDYWDQWHFWYWWGCGPTGMEIKRPSWVEVGDTILECGPIKICSPYRGLVYSPKKYRRSMDVSTRYSCDRFFEIRPIRNSFTPDIGYIYRPILDYIEEYHHKRRKGTIAYFFDQKIGLGLDPKQKFEDYDDLMAHARDIVNVRAQKFDIADAKPEFTMT